jgi:hypothetical protein
LVSREEREEREGGEGGEGKEAGWLNVLSASRRQYHLDYGVRAKRVGEINLEMHEPRGK